MGDAGRYGCRAIEGEWRNVTVLVQRSLGGPEALALQQLSDELDEIPTLPVNLLTEFALPAGRDFALTCPPATGKYYFLI
jgi:hypothetical protein